MVETRFDPPFDEADGAATAKRRPGRRDAGGGAPLAGMDDSHGIVRIERDGGCAHDVDLGPRAQELGVGRMVDDPPQPAGAVV